MDKTNKELQELHAHLITIVDDREFIEEIYLLSPQDLSALADYVGAKDKDDPTAVSILSRVSAIRQANLELFNTIKKELEAKYTTK